MKFNDKVIRFFYMPDIFISIPSAVPGDPILDPNGKMLS